MIKVTDLRKSYGNHIALHGISFSIQQGEFYGLLGPNGAGKSTTIGIMSMLIAPDSGSISINNHDILQHPVQCKQTIGVVPQEIALYNELSAIDNLLFWGGLYNVEKTTLKKRIDTTLQLFGLSDRANDKVKTYSGGMKRRINIAAALLHDPKVLFMDEPTVGIDPQSRNLIFEVVQKLHSEGMTIVYTTHYMEEAERFCDRIGIIDNGKIVAQGSLHELKSMGGNQEAVMISGNGISEATAEKMRNAGFKVSAEENQLTFLSHNLKGDLSRIVLMCSEHGIDINDISIKHVNLETVFLSLTGKQLRD